MRRLTIHRACVVLLALMIAAVGCQSSVVVPIRVRVASTIDTQRYSTFVVIPFVDEDDRMPPAQLERLAELMRERLERVRNVTVVSRAVTNDLMTGENLNELTVKDPDYIRQWGDMFEADAVITANVRYYTVLDSRHRPVDRYSYRLQRYVSEVETELVRSHYLSLDFAAFDAKDGATLFERRKSARYSESHNALSAVVSEISGASEIAMQLAQRPVREFVRQITPHYEYEERFLVR